MIHDSRVFFLCFFNSTFLLLFMIIGECVTNAMVMTMMLQDMGPARVFEGRPYTEGREAAAESGRESGGSEQRHGRVGGGRRIRRCMGDLQRFRDA